ncbi:MAG: porin family protein [Bacteroidetes bacterium]|nr:porin family protein [Bacteroidota bacterium]
MIICVIVLFTVTEANAQKKVGGGVWYATEMENVGISINGAYFFSDNFSVAPSFTYFLEKNHVNWSMLDLDVNYSFTELDFGNLYAIGGLNLTFFSVDLGGWGNASGTNTSFNAGIGLGMPIGDNMTLCPEVRYTFGDGDFLRIGVKLLIEI